MKNRARLFSILYADYPMLARDNGAAEDLFIYMEESLVRSFALGSLAEWPEQPFGLLLHRLRWSVLDMKRRLDRLRRIEDMGKQELMLLEEQALGPATCEDVPDAQKALVRRYIARLRWPSHRRVLGLWLDSPELDDDELADDLLLTLDSFRSTRSRALRALRKLMNDEGHGGLFN